MSPFDSLRSMMSVPDMAAAIRDGLIGEDALIPTPTGPKRLVYADYVASGRALRQVEDLIRDDVLPFYANTHSESSFVGAYMTRLREEARRIISMSAEAPESHVTLFSGSGATSGLNQLVRLLDVERVASEGRAVVLVGPYEHHSNILPWRDAGAEVIELPEGPLGGPDTEALESCLRRNEGADLVIGAFSAASNVTGTLTDVDRVTTILRRHGALSVWDYACAAPYMPVTVGQGTARKDALVFSAHKFVGGPGASGVLICDRSLARRAGPTRPGGGTVDFVSPWSHRYSGNLIDREEGGTPNIVGDIRAAMAVLIRDMVNRQWLHERQQVLRERALSAWRRIPNLQVLGHEPGRAALPIFPLVFRDAARRPIDPGAAARALSDRYGLQVRGGCSCAGPYGHRLLGIGRLESERLLARIAAGEACAKPGWVRLNLSPYLEDGKADWIIETITDFACSVAGSGDWQGEAAHAAVTQAAAPAARTG